VIDGIVTHDEILDILPESVRVDFDNRLRGHLGPVDAPPPKGLFPCVCGCGRFVRRGWDGYHGA
jgi:hypothetical protein